jgi:hypothetical protein
VCATETDLKYGACRAATPQIDAFAAAAAVPPRCAEQAARRRGRCGVMQERKPRFARAEPHFRLVQATNRQPDRTGEPRPLSDGPENEHDREEKQLRRYGSGHTVNSSRSSMRDSAPCAAFVHLACRREASRFATPCDLGAPEVCSSHGASRTRTGDLLGAIQLGPFFLLRRTSWMFLLAGLVGDPSPGFTPLRAASVSDSCHSAGRHVPEKVTGATGVSPTFPPRRGASARSRSEAIEQLP